MVITVRLKDWILLITGLVIWGMEHWYISCALSYLCLSGTSYLPHAIHCICALIILCTLIYIIFRSYYDSFFYFFLVILYSLFLIASAYVWYSMLSRDKLLLGLCIMIFSLIITVIISVYFSRSTFNRAVLFFPIFAWRFFLTFLKFLCFYVT